MTLFANIWNSIYGPKFYPALLKQKTSFSLKYFFGFVAALAFVTTLVAFLLTGSSMTPSALAPSLQKYEAIFPDNLVITIKDGEASANVPMPYFIDAPDDSFLRDNEINGGNEPPSHLIAIDTTQEASLGLFKQYDSYMLLSKDSFITYNNNGQLRIIPLESASDTTLDKAFVSKVISKIKSFLPLVIPFFFLFVFFIVYCFLAFEAIYMFFGALFVWAALRIMKVPTGYWKSYQIGLHAMTLPLILSIPLLRFSELKFPFWFTIVTVLVVTANVRSARRAAKHHS